MAYWSLSGLVLPIAGVILGIISLSTVGVISPTTDKERLDISRVRRFAWVGIILSIVMAIAGTIGVVYLRHHDNVAADSNAVTGTLTLHDQASFGSMQSGDSCQGSDGYDDIVSGAQVVVSNDSGSVLALSQLDDGVADGSGNCVFNFAIDKVPRSNFYRFEVSHRGQLDYSYQQLSSAGFSVAMTLGD
jgi:hypothetical protein